MELNFEELDNPSDPVNNPNNVTPQTEINYINYWSNANPTANESSNPKKPKVSYDDILSSLNMVVNNGVLQFAKPVKQEPKNQEAKSQQKKQVTIREPQQQQQRQHPNQNNYITNKYFKDYQEHQQDVDEEPPRPLTKEEYRQMMIQDYINRQQAQIRLSQIKSRKLLFNTQHINIAPNQMPRDMNKLFKPFTR
jgi:hypothetical protein